ncbi:MAG: hypothetical protein QM718_00020 [Steroidobacteraceae bacterium]
MRTLVVILVVLAQLTGGVAEAAHLHAPADMQRSQELGQDLEAAASLHAPGAALSATTPDQPSAHPGCDRCSHGLGHSIVRSHPTTPELAASALPLANLGITACDEWCPATPFEPPR